MPQFPKKIGDRRFLTDNIIGSPMLWLPACARARHCIVVLYPIQCLARAQAGNHNIGLPMIIYNILANLKMSELHFDNRKLGFLFK